MSRYKINTCKKLKRAHKKMISSFDTTNIKVVKDSIIYFTIKDVEPIQTFLERRGIEIEEINGTRI